MDLEQQVQDLMDREAIKELRYQYCYRWDTAVDTDEFLDLFTEDAVFDLTEAETVGRAYEGHEGVAEFYDDRHGEDREFDAHHVHNPVIDIDGDTATGKWYFEVPTTMDGEAGWIQGVYDETYERVDGEWKFSEVNVIPNYMVDYHEGWTEAVADR
jgi:hypothetical protein